MRMFVAIQAENHKTIVPRNQDPASPGTILPVGAVMPAGELLTPAGSLPQLNDETIFEIRPHRGGWQCSEALAGTCRRP